MIKALFGYLAVVALGGSFAYVVASSTASAVSESLFNSADMIANVGRR